MLILKTCSRVITKLYITMHYQGERYYIETLEWEWFSIEMSNYQWLNQLRNLNQLNKECNANT